MKWISPNEKDTAGANLEKRLWDAADQFRANSGLRSHADLAQGWFFLPVTDDDAAYFEDFPRLVCGLNILVAARCGYSGPILACSRSGQSARIHPMKEGGE